MDCTSSSNDRRKIVDNSHTTTLRTNGSLALMPPSASMHVSTAVGGSTTANATTTENEEKSLASNTANKQADKQRKRRVRIFARSSCGTESDSTRSQTAAITDAANTSITADRPSISGERPTLHLPTSTAPKQSPLTSHGISGVVYSWISSYLSNRTQYVRCPGSRSTSLPVLCGVPQGSVLGPILFLLYTSDLVQLVESIELYPHLYADDTQVYGFCRPGDTDSLQQRVDCVAAVANWMRSNRLQLNASKTEILWCASARRQSQLPSDPLDVGSDLVSPVRCVRDFCIFIDADLTMRTQVSQTCSKCFAAFRQLRSIRRSVSNDVMQSLIVALVFSRLDYGSATLAGLPKQLMDRLQSVQNAAARLIFNACRQDHIQP